MLEILTPLSKTHRVSRKIDTANVVAVPGIWGELAADGSLANIDGGTTDKAAIFKLIIGNASSNIYESHDVEVGRISTIEDTGIRVVADTEGYAGSPSQGDDLTVSVAADATAGKLITATGTAAERVVAICEEVNATAGTITYKLADATKLS